MACCGRGRRRNNPRPTPIAKTPATKPTVRVGVNRCVHCGGELKANPSPIKLGAQMVVKCKCKKCGKQMYRIQR